MIDIVEIGSFKRTEIDFSGYGLKKNKEYFIDNIFQLLPEKKHSLETYLSSKKYILANYKDENQKYIQQIILPPINGTTIFNISRNYIHFIPFNELPDSILKFDISHTFISQTEIDKFPSEARYIKISETNISKISEIPERCVFFIARGCRLREVGRLPVIIEELFLEGNNLLRLPENLMECNHLTQLSYEGNRNIKVSNEELNFIERTFERRRLLQEDLEREIKIKMENSLKNMAEFVETNGGLDNNIIKLADNKNNENLEIKINNVILNSQNVHDSMINSNMEDACRKLKAFYEDKLEKNKVFFIKKSLFGKDKVVKNDLGEFIGFHCIEKIKKAIGILGFNNLKRWMDDKSLIFMRADNTTFGDVCRYVFFRSVFLTKEDENEFYEMLGVDFNEMDVVCLTGKLGRMINLLNGKCDEVKLIGESKSDRIQRILNLCKFQARANYKNMVYKNHDFVERNKFEINEETFLFRKILYLLFEVELKKMVDVSDNEREIWLEPLIYDDNEIDKIKSSGNDEFEIEKMVEKEIEKLDF